MALRKLTKSAGDIWLLVRWRGEGSHSVVQGKNVVSQEPPYMEGQFVVVKDAKRTYDAEVLYAGTKAEVLKKQDEMEESFSEEESLTIQTPALPQNEEGVVLESEGSGSPEEDKKSRKQQATTSSPKKTSTAQKKQRRSLATTSSPKKASTAQKKQRRSLPKESTAIKRTVKKVQMQSDANLMDLIEGVQKGWEKDKENAMDKEQQPQEVAMESEVSHNRQDSFDLGLEDWDHGFDDRYPKETDLPKAKPTVNTPLNSSQHWYSQMENGPCSSTSYHVTPYRLHHSASEPNYFPRMETEAVHPFSTCSSPGFSGSGFSCVPPIGKSSSFTNSSQWRPLRRTSTPEEFMDFSSDTSYSSGKMQYLCDELEHVKQSITRLECTVDLLQNMLVQKRRRKSGALEVQYNVPLPSPLGGPSASTSASADASANASAGSSAIACTGPFAGPSTSAASADTSASGTGRVYLGNARDPAHRVEVIGVDRKAIQAAENCSASPEALARALLSAIFTPEEINTGNCTKPRRKDIKLLDQNKIQGIREHINYIFPISSPKEEMTRWKNLLRFHLNQKCRTDRVDADPDP